MGIKSALLMMAVGAAVILAVFMAGTENGKRGAAVEAAKAAYREGINRENSDKKTARKSGIDLCVAAGGVRNECRDGVRRVEGN